MKELEKLTEAIIKGNMEIAQQITQQALNEGVNVEDIISKYLIKGMQEIGLRFETGKAFVPELLMAARAMKSSLDLLKPYLEQNKSSWLGKVIIGTVKGDLHDIGKNLVASMLEGSGFEVINIGIDVSSDKFVEAVKAHQPDIVCLSALLTTTMQNMKDVIIALEKEGLRDKVKIIIGGAPVSSKFAKEIGADGYSDNANSAVSLAKSILAV
jgi:corrinoid protein of di/trimethylamine methyltransferase